MSSEIPFIRPRFPASADIAADLDSIVASNWYTNFGPKEREFAAAIAASIGEGYHAVTFANATIALIGLVQEALGRGDGTRHVIVPSFTFAAGPEAIEWAGYRPIFIDIEPDTLQPSLDDARAAVATTDVAGVLLTNSFGIGNPAIRAWEQWARAASLPLLVDSAAGFGSAYADGPVGSAGLAEVFSFHATKPFAIGEGGAVVTRDPALADRLRSVQNFGFSGDRSVHTLGFNGKLAELSAAIGLRQLQVFDGALAERRRIVERYRAGAPSGWHLPEAIETSSVCFATIVAPDAERRDAALARLSEVGVEARTYYAPVVHTQPRYRASARVGALEVTDAIASRVLSLPVFEDLRDDEIDKVLAALAEADR